MDECAIGEATRLGIVPFGDGHCVIEHLPANLSGQNIHIIEHYLSGRKREYSSIYQYGRLELTLHQTRANEFLEWLEIVFSLDKNIL
jgi:hypothetical protein